MLRRRAKNLDDHDIANIVAILDGWKSKLSWELFIKEIARRLHSTYTRQALHQHVRIKDAFSMRKRLLSEGRGAGHIEAASPELRAALERIERLKGENARLSDENDRLLEQFVVWAYNANTKDLDEEFLSRPLPNVNRKQTPRREKGAKPDKH